MEKEKMPTYDEFREQAKKYFKDGWPKMPDKEVERYLHTDDAKLELDRAYEKNKKQFEQGEISRKQFLIGGAASVGYCLELMY